MIEIIDKKTPKNNCLKSRDLFEANSKGTENFKLVEKMTIDANFATKIAMAKELKKIGLSDDAISRQLNINYQRR